MVEHLINLANYLDRKNLIKASAIVDSFIIKNSQLSDPTWSGEEELSDYSGEFEFEPESPEELRNKSNKIKLSENVSLDLNTHPLGQLILKYINNAFQAEDSGIENFGLITVKDIQEIVRLASKFDEDLNYHEPKRREQYNPISPIQMKYILNEAMKMVGKSYQTKGILNTQEVVNNIDNLYKNYEDFYFKNVLGMDSPAIPKSETDGMPFTLPPELDEEDLEELARQQEEHIGGAADVSWLEEVEREGDPEKYQRRMEQRRWEDKRKFPQEWHEVLFPK